MPLELASMACCCSRCAFSASMRLLMSVIVPTVPGEAARFVPDRPDVPLDPRDAATRMLQAQL